MIGAATAALFIWTRQSADAVIMPDGYIPPLDPNPPPPLDPSIENSIVNTISPLAAFLYMIRSTENPSVADADRYFRFYGNSTFSDMSDHPVNTGEKSGVKLSDAMCRAAGFSPGCVSTAAGAYQITRPTWDEVRASGAWGPFLEDFSQASQDEAARRILIQVGATPYIPDNLPLAIARASSRWASLPGSTAQQHPSNLDVALAYFNDAAQVFG